MACSVAGFPLFTVLIQSNHRLLRRRPLKHRSLSSLRWPSSGCGRASLLDERRELSEVSVEDGGDVIRPVPLLCLHPCPSTVDGGRLYRSWEAGHGYLEVIQGGKSFVH
ncbi:hypothetical protein BDW22DRAFT_1361288 [Trametopsis cervina]|nr:hypothetical protein BDW22DRAFT_1361288 [Trametopsis cervina]